jgi:LCP family protein required for cell wall assembly
MQNFPFKKGSVMRKQFPDGFKCDGCMLNGVNTWAIDNRELFGKSKQPGVDATVMAVEGITGLKINYWAMVDLRGFRQLVDAVGGVTINVRQRIPVGGLGDDVYDYIEPGVQKLTGFETQWYARAREGSDDYSRMARQKCVMAAMLDQLDPAAVLSNFQGIAQAGSAMLSTSVPASEVDRFIDLALKAKGQKVSTLSVVPPVFDTYQPDVKLIRQKVSEAIATAEGNAPKKEPVAAEPSSGTEQVEKPKKQKQPEPQPQPVIGGSLGSLGDGYVANQTEDLGKAC